jgi:hypothetical protein
MKHQLLLFLSPLLTLSKEVIPLKFLSDMEFGATIIQQRSQSMTCGYSIAPKPSIKLQFDEERVPDIASIEFLKTSFEEKQPTYLWTRDTLVGIFKIGSEK